MGLSCLVVAPNVMGIYMKDASLWNESIAELIAQKEEIELSDDHWQVISYVRKFYDEFNTSPSIRPLVKYLSKVLPAEKTCRELTHMS